MVVRVHRLLAAKLAARQFDRAVGDDLVGIHVRLRTRSGLKHDQREMRVQPAVDHLVRSAHDEFGLHPGQLAKFDISLRGGLLQQAERTDHRSLPTEALDPDGEVFDRALGLRPPVAFGRHFNAAHGVGFRACGVHDALLLTGLSMNDARIEIESKKKPRRASACRAGFASVMAALRDAIRP